MPAPAMERRTIENTSTANVSRKPLIAGTLSCVFFFVIGLFILWQRYHLLIEDRQEEMSGIVNIVEQNIEQSLKYSYSAALSLALQIDKDGVIDNFDEIASQLVDNNPNIDAIEIVPNGIITQVYPYKENADAIGYNILKDSTRNKEARIAIETRKMFFAGPLKLKQGGYAVVGRLPVFIQNKFWGFSAVLIHFDNLLRQSGIRELSKGEYSFQFTKQDPDTGKEVFLLEEGTTQLQESYSEDIALPDGNWKIYIVPDHPHKPLYSLIPLCFLIFLLSLAFGYLIFKILKQPSVLEQRVKEQAGALTKSELRFRTIFNQAAIGMARVDSNSGMILETNKRFQELLGYSAEELKKMDYKMVSHPDDLTENTFLMRELRENKIREYSLKKRLALAVLSLQIDSMEAEIIKQIPEGMKVFFNPAYLESVLLNFITNALRYSHPDRKPKIEISGTRFNGRWKLRISDNGIGIDLKKHGDKVFGLYKTFSGRKGSRGVGLFITKNQINAMGGEVKVESEAGKGTSFIIYFK